MPVTDPTTVENRVHLDLTSARDRDQESGCPVRTYCRMMLVCWRR